MSPSVSDYSGHEGAPVVKSAIVTGGAQGIGLALVRGLAQDGFNVILNDLASKQEIGQAAAKSISSATGQRVIFMGGDVSSEADVDALVQRAVDEFGGLDVMVANAAVCTVNSVMDTTISEWNLNMNVNALGVLFCYRSAARQMIKQGRGGRLIGNPTVAAYSASKFAMRGLTQSAALEFAPHKITVNCFSGGCINTAMHHDTAQTVSDRMNLPKEMLIKGAYSEIPLGYCGQPEDVAGLVSYLASPASHYMTVNGDVDSEAAMLAPLELDRATTPSLFLTPPESSTCVPTSLDPQPEIESCADVMDSQLQDWEKETINLYVKQGYSLQEATALVLEFRKQGKAGKKDEKKDEKEDEDKQQAVTCIHSEVSQTLKFPDPEGDVWTKKTKKTVSEDLNQFKLDALPREAWAAIKPGMPSKAHGQGTGCLKSVGVAVQPTSRTPKTYKATLVVVIDTNVTNLWLVKLEYDGIPEAKQIIKDLQFALDKDPGKKVGERQKKGW
ncbi:hypothetical protein FRC06_003225 [Ceratobasidium sp. 370]|nr:hypothetical protein FRC06_003225 [Ceratobasidium sp. 370]